MFWSVSPVTAMVSYISVLKNEIIVVTGHEDGELLLHKRPLFLTESGARSLDLMSMKLKVSECERLNYSVIRMYVFDATDRSKAYGYTSDGDLVHVLVLGDRNFHMPRQIQEEARC
ncbi:hypothetical protein MLD38_012923 [Melastoma candidum]|uniref:Uncharacterized protein n=1 Tax=Melastoma candidum TaxID=119954 RepID=A0ACB9R802_9MYRT|nr:hypothetical protein MLD38_012923 [Melastoma candidum]